MSEDAGQDLRNASISTHEALQEISAKLHLTTLPVELLLYTLSFTDIWDILSLRKVLLVPDIIRLTLLDQHSLHVIDLRLLSSNNTR